MTVFEKSSIHLLSVYSAICIMALSDSALADPGTWVPDDSFSQLNAACFRVYKCTADSIVFDPDHYALVLTPPESSTGVCSGFDSCDDCNTNPPAKTCEWSVVPK